MNFDWKALVVAVDGDVGVVGVFVEEARCVRVGCGNGFEGRVGAGLGWLEWMEWRECRGFVVAFIWRKE